MEWLQTHCLNKENLCRNKKQTDNNMATKDGFIIHPIKKMDNA